MVIHCKYVTVIFALCQSMSYYLCPGSIDMRKGIYSLYQIVKSEMKRNPLSGEVFIFLGKNRRCIKILHWEKDHISGATVETFHGKGAHSA